MAKSISDKLKEHGIAASRGTVTYIDPKGLTLITDTKAALYDPRVAEPLDEGLVLDIMQHGVLQAILCRDNGVDKNGPRIEVVAGRRRLRHLLEANVRREKTGLPSYKMPVVIVHGDDREMVNMAIAENAHRKEESVMSLAWKVRTSTKLGSTAEEIGIGPQRVRRLLAFLDLSKVAQEAVNNKQLPLSAIDELAQVPREEQPALVASMLANNVTKSHEVADAVDAAKNGKSYTPPDRKKSWGRREMKSFLTALDGAPKNRETIVARAMVDFILGDDKALAEFDHLKTAAAAVRKELRKKGA